ncbi:hypothetical protein BC941DRAFT_439920 [Chlamydoabsidia padenii]|nr:hypothetical protein BC941DRAFT_439920 [Chlamydoabsidia padenii]
MPIWNEDPKSQNVNTCMCFHPTCVILPYFTNKVYIASCMVHTCQSVCIFCIKVRDKYLSDNISVSHHVECCEADS